MLTRRCLALLFCSCMCLECGLGAQAGNPSPDTDAPVKFSHQPVTGIGHEAGACRRDPSDVIKATDVFTDQSVLSGSHEVLVWPHEAGVAALCSISETIQFAKDGLHFTRLASARNRPNAPGGYRPDAFSDVQMPRPMLWGIR